jgi:hypothetical protein
LHDQLREDVLERVVWPCDRYVFKMWFGHFDVVDCVWVGGSWVAAWESGQAKGRSLATRSFSAGCKGATFLFVGWPVVALALLGAIVTRPTPSTAL